MWKRIVLALCLVALATPTAPVRAAGYPVIDLTNLVQTTLSAVRLLNQFNLMRQQYEDLRENWKSMVLNQLMLKALESRDARLAASAINAIQYLDPNNANWREAVESLLRMHYDLPMARTETALLRSIYSGNLEPLLQRVRDEERMRAPVLDAHYFQSAQEKAGRNRQQALDSLQDRLNTLGEKSETRQLQAIAAAVVLLGRQQEATIDALHAKMTQDQHPELMRLSAIQNARRAQREHASMLRIARNPCNGPCLRNW